MKTDEVVDEGTSKVIFLLSPRHELAQLVKSLFNALSAYDISVLPLVTETGVGEWKDVENIFYGSKIVFKKLADFSHKTALEILLKEKPNLLVTDNDLLNLKSSFVFSGRYLHIPTMVIRETTSILDTKLNFIWTFSEILSKSNQLPRFLKTYLFYVRSMAAVKPILLMNVPNLIKVLLRGFEGKIVGQYADYILANTLEDAESLRKQCPHAQFVSAVGNPRFDETLNSGVAERLQVRKEVQQLFKIPSNKKIILFLSSAQVEHGGLAKEQKRTANQQILGVLEELQEETDIIIKLHPTERNIFPLIWKPNYDNFIHVTSFDLSKLIVASDFVISWFSTAMINVVLARKPLIVIDFFDDRAHGGILLSTQAIADYGAALVASNANELHESLSAILRDDRLRKTLKQSQDFFCANYLKTIDGNSINRIAEAIKEVAVAK